MSALRSATEVKPSVPVPKHTATPIRGSSCRRLVPEPPLQKAAYTTSGPSSLRAGQQWAQPHTSPHSFTRTNVGKLEADAADPTQGTYTDGPEIDYYSGWPGPQQPWIKRTEVGAGGEVGVSAMSMAKTERYGWGAAAVGKYFVFGPYNYSGVGVMDTESGAIEYYPLEISGCWENQGIMRGTIFEYDWPFQEICLKGPEGSEEALAGARTCSWGSVQDSAPWGCFNGAAALGTKVYFTPHNANEVGVFDTATMSWSLIPLNINLAHYKRCAGCRLEDITGGCLDWDGRFPTGGQCYSCMEGYKYCTNGRYTDFDFNVLICVCPEKGLMSANSFWKKSAAGDRSMDDAADRTPPHFCRRLTVDSALRCSTSTALESDLISGLG